MNTPTKTRNPYIVENTTGIPLLPCPFSGRPAEISAFIDEEFGEIFSVSAPHITGSDTAEAFSAGTLKEAVNGWNQRCNTPSDDELKTCPFCGASAEYTSPTQEEVDEWGLHEHHIGCSEYCNGNPGASASTRSSAVAKWNTRA